MTTLSDNPLGTSPLTGTLTRGLAADANSLNALKFKAGQDGGKGAVKEAAKQFEALFMREVLKSMREATTKSGLMDGDSGESMATDMLDQQFAQSMTGLPGGLSKAIERQLTQQMNVNAKDNTTGMSLQSTFASGRALTAYQKASVAETASATSGAPIKTTDRQMEFVAKHLQSAEQVAAEVGIPATYMLGQAGHETGWGRAEIKGPNGENSFNLFGVKAGKNWKGKVTEITTTEYVDGQPRTVKARFRAYDSYADAFRDYAKLITDNPRYDRVMDNLQSPQAFAAQLQKAGYATDPQYANKLSRAIASTQQVQREVLARSRPGGVSIQA